MKRLLLFAGLSLWASAQDRPPAGPPSIPTEPVPVSTLALELPRAPYNYARPELPFFYLEQGVANLDNTPSFNLVSDLGATLGRVLFYDKALSQNRTLACASCHQAATGFADAATLGEVVEHYNSGVQNDPNLDNPLRRNGSVRRLNFTDAEKQAMVAFLRTLSDEEMARDPKFSDPFRGR